MPLAEECLVESTQDRERGSEEEKAKIKDSSTDLRDPAKTLPKTANAGEKQNESNLDRKFDQKIKANAIFCRRIF